jgi:hypothetical protein
MNVHLIRTQDVTIDHYNDVLNLLRSFNGEVQFVSHEEEQIIDLVTTKNWKDEDEFIRQDYPKLSINQEMALGIVDFEPISFPYKEKQVTWEDLFQVCRDHRLAHNIGESDIVFVLTSLGNEFNWFGAVDENMRDIFLQTAHWSQFFGSAVDGRFPVCYEVAAWLLRIRMFTRREDILNAMHQQSLGCMMDFCKKKKEIVVKMRTADICQDCLSIIGSRDLSRPFVQQMLEIMDGIRRHLLFRERSKYLNRPSRLEIRGYMHRIFLSELGDLEVLLNPKEKTLFIFFLKHPEGLLLAELPDHQAEIVGLYSRFSNRQDPAEIMRAVWRLINPVDQNQMQVLSRIRRRFKDLVGSNLSGYYTIEVRDGKYAIALNREWVQWCVE